MPRRAAVDRRRAAARVLRHVRRRVHRAQFVDEVLGVVALVGAERDRPRPIGARLDHVQRRDPLGVAVGLGQTGVDDEAVAVLHQRMAHEAELGFLARPLAIEPRLGSVVDACVSFERFWPWKSASRFRPPPCGGGSPEPSFGRKLFIDAQASTSVPSTEK